jgi:hypothetical protein
LVSFTPQNILSWFPNGWKEESPLLKRFDYTIFVTPTEDFCVNQCLKYLNLKTTEKRHYKSLLELGNDIYNLNKIPIFIYNIKSGISIEQANTFFCLHLHKSFVAQDDTINSTNCIRFLIHFFFNFKHYS